MLSFGAESLVFQFVTQKYTQIDIYRNMLLPVVLCGCETWSLTMKEERRLRVSENWVMRIFGPKSGKVREAWRKFNNEELNDLYSSPNIIPVIKFGRMRWAGHVARCKQGFGGET